MKKYTREQLEKELKIVNSNNRKELAVKIKDFNSSKVNKEIYV